MKIYLDMDGVSPRRAGRKLVLQLEQLCRTGNHLATVLEPMPQHVGLACAALAAGLRVWSADSVPLR